ncbi:ribosome biogenesis regulatory protein-domain-containing protein [Jimgerdemannia flammicorona]|uniref:Ribosome biogenesis regulatory protein n=1 Tax=Jimgerdemannia flammicorona TaxID=994334 RepID=A0A433QJA4_9FUNG|nr:ribosome biogenesis regulatory protein-domain-containing protein [Jimgerdemannia flammicorona]
MDVSEQLESAKAKYKSTTVEKLIPLEYDLSLLAAYDTNPLDATRLKANADAYLKEHTRDGTQLLFNQIFSLPIVSTDVGVVATLPTSRTTVLPREKPLPKLKPPTRWERFANAKGIQKHKKDKMIFDERTGEYVPRWGYKAGPKDDLPEDWLIEVPNGADPMEDQYAKRAGEKKERIAKNKKRQQRNLEEAAGKEKGQDAREVRDARKRQLAEAIAVSKTATASVGKFDKKLEGEPKAKGLKRKFEPNIADLKTEKESSLNILNKVVGKGEVLNVKKAIRVTRS